MTGPAADASTTLRAWLRAGPSPAAFEAALAEVPARDRDAWLDALLQIDELPDDEPLPRGCVPYLPADVATVWQAVRAAAVTRDDVFVDIGAGLGRPLLLTHLLTGAMGIGLEIQPGLVRAARARADRLNLTRVRFIEGDAASQIEAAATGTVFFMYCPFGGERLDRVLTALARIGEHRKIRVCCVGMPPLAQPWLAAVPATSVDLTVYESVEPGF